DYETSKDVRATSTMTLPTTVSGIRFYLNIRLQIEFVLNRGGDKGSFFIFYTKRKIRTNGSGESFL
ncbi:hypothetical protein, partial [Bacteroides heparinolyticus]|uniref:hypothetical protein n=1 Tax=Prevotella heparinolytica TaxID=28113 RepID=UPI00359F8BE2